MPRKPIKVYLSAKQKKILATFCDRLGMDESEALRFTFLMVAKSVSLMTEAVHGKTNAKVLMSKDEILECMKKCYKEMQAEK